MPPLGMHMTVARELVPQTAQEMLEADPGAYYLGATTPDIRVLTRSDRSETHFFDLSNLGHQSGVEAIFKKHPELAVPGRLNRSTVAFLCGYISHLEMDEAWITDIFRPCFGKNSTLKGGALANVLDRLLQYELDRREREDLLALAEIRGDLLASTMDVVVGFVDGETLARWRDISADLLKNPLDWDRFGIIAGRHLKAYGVKTEEDKAHFIRNIPDLLDQAIRQVTPERIESFQQRSREQALAAIQGYLS